MKKESVENYIRNLKGHIYTNKIMVVLYEETRDVYHLIYKIKRSTNICVMASYQGTEPRNYEVSIPFIDSLDHYFGDCKILCSHEYLQQDIRAVMKKINKIKNEVAD